MAYTVEKAKILDIPELLELAVHFWNESETYSQRPMDLATVKTHLQTLILYPSQGCVLVCRDETGKILGGFVGGLTREWFSATSLMAFDYCLFVSSNNRGSKVAYMLVTAFIEWAKEAGATIIQCGTATKINTERTISFYKKFGFEHIGTTFYAAGRYMNAKGNADLPEAEVHKAEADFNATVEQAQADADVSSMPNVAETVDDLAQHEANLNQAIDQVMKGEKVNISEATGGKLKTLDDVKKHIQANQKKQPTLEELTAKMASNIGARLVSNKDNNTANNTSIKIDIKAPIAPKKDQLVKDTYQLAQAAGFSPAQARALVGEVGRENGFNPNTMFGFHTDQANSKKNGGIFSWQGSRATALEAHMRAKGLVNANGTFKQTNESLQAQFEFLRKEIEANPKWKANFLDKKNITNDEARSALGGAGSVIGWARGQNKLSSGKAFDWKSHEATANNYSNMVDGQPTSHVFESATESNVEQAPIKPESSYEGTVDRLDLDNLPDVDDLFISPHDFNAFEQRNMEHEVMGDLTTEQLDLPNMVLDENGNLVPDLPDPNYKPMSDAELSKLIDDVFAESETVSVPHTSNTIKVKDRVDDPAKEFKPDESIAADWKEKQRYEDKKYHKELTRSYTDKEGNLVQELQYRGSYVRRTVDDAHQTKSIHVGRSNKSNFVDHKGNKELETALDRIFDEGRAFGYLSQIPKGQQTIDKLIANPDLVISSKKTGEDLTAAQWKDKLIREQDNIQMMAKAMSTLLQQIQRTEAPTGEKLVTNKDIFNASDDLFLDTFQFDKTGYTAQELADQAFRLKEQLANKYMNYIYTETNAAVLEVGARETTFMGLGRERGTVTNELSRFFWQFKQFPLAMIMRQWTRGMAQGTPQEKFVYFAKLFAYTTVMGGLVAQIQNLTQGKDLDDPTTLDFYMKSIVKGGSASFLADAISATSDPTERSVKDFIIPAAFKDVMSVGTMVSGAGKQFLDERDSSYGAEAINIAKNNIPFQNVWYTRLVFDRLVIAELQDLFDEGYRERKQRRQESNYGISYWWDLDNNEIRVPDTNSRSE